LSLGVKKGEILGIIGPAKSGKTSLLRTLNRLNELNPSFRSTGEVLLDGKDIRKMDVNLIRRKVGMIFVLPIPLPTTIFKNVVYGLRLQKSDRDLRETCEQALRDAYLWDEVKDRLYESALRLSGGQQQRLCIARTLALQPEVILYDEPCSGLDPISTAKVEETMVRLKDRHATILVTNNTKQAARVVTVSPFS
jgi:phosphate transport system ATP-binding protein